MKHHSLNFLSRGQLENFSLDKFFLAVFKILPCYQVSPVTLFLPISLGKNRPNIFADQENFSSWSTIFLQLFIIRVNMVITTMHNSTVLISLQLSPPKNSHLDY